MTATLTRARRLSVVVRRIRVRATQSGPAVEGALPCERSDHVDRIGTSVLESRNDAIIANPTASDNGTNRDRVTPVMKNEGTNTATTASMASTRGPTTSPPASS